MVANNSTILLNFLEGRCNLVAEHFSLIWLNHRYLAFKKTIPCKSGCLFNICYF
jgi:hypothetical protein